MMTRPSIRALKKQAEWVKAAQTFDQAECARQTAHDRAIRNAALEEAAVIAETKGRAFGEPAIGWAISSAIRALKTP